MDLYRRHFEMSSLNRSYARQSVGNEGSCRLPRATVATGDYEPAAPYRKARNWARKCAKPHTPLIDGARSAAGTWLQIRYDVEWRCRMNGFPSNSPNQDLIAQRAGQEYVNFHAQRLRYSLD